MLTICHLAERWRTADGQFCRKCGEKNDNAAAYCDQCGEQFPDSASDDAANSTLAKPPTGVASKVTADHAVKMEQLYQARDAELANAWRAK